MEFATVNLLLESAILDVSSKATIELEQIMSVKQAAGF